MAKPVSRASGESFVWLTTIFLVFVSCGTAMLSAEQPAGSDTLISGAPEIRDPQDNPLVTSSVVALVRRSAMSTPSLASSRFGSRDAATLGKAVLCSGVLISERLVLTAAHCFDNQDATGIAVYFPFGSAGEAAGQGVSLGTLRTVDVHPGYDSRLPVNPDDLRPTGDLAVVALESPAPSRYRAAALAQPSGSLPSRFVVAGFGVTLSRSVFDGGLLRSATLNLRRAHPQKQLIETFGGTAAAPIGGCAGDSGAPLFGTAGGVVGILSTGGEVAGRCVGTNAFTDLRQSTSWITAAAERAGATLRFLSAEDETKAASVPSEMQWDAGRVSAALREGRATLPLALSRPKQSATEQSPAEQSRPRANSAEAVVRDVECQIDVRMEYALNQEGQDRQVVSRWRSPRFVLSSAEGSGIVFEVPAPVIVPRDLRIVPVMACDGQRVTVQPPEVRGPSQSLAKSH